MEVSDILHAIVIVRIIEGHRTRTAEIIVMLDLLPL